MFTQIYKNNNKYIYIYTEIYTRKLHHSCHQSCCQKIPLQNTPRTSAREVARVVKRSKRFGIAQCFRMFFQTLKCWYEMIRFCQTNWMLLGMFEVRMCSKMTPEIGVRSPNRTQHTTVAFQRCNIVIPFLVAFLQLGCIKKKRVTKLQELQIRLYHLCTTQYVRSHTPCATNHHKSIATQPRHRFESLNLLSQLATTSWSPFKGNAFEKPSGNNDTEYFTSKVDEIKTKQQSPKLTDGK